MLISNILLLDPTLIISFQVALRCLAQLSGSMNICELFVSLVKRFDLEDTPLEPDSQECKTDEEDRMDELVKKKDRKDAESTEFKTDEVDMKDGESTECKTDEIGRKDEKSTDATVELNNKRFVASFHSPKRLDFHVQSVSVQKRAHKLLDDVVLLVHVSYDETQSHLVTLC